MQLKCSWRIWIQLCGSPKPWSFHHTVVCPPDDLVNLEKSYSHSLLVLSPLERVRQEACKVIFQLNDSIRWGAPGTATQHEACSQLTISLHQLCKPPLTVPCHLWHRHSFHMEITGWPVFCIGFIVVSWGRLWPLPFPDECAIVDLISSLRSPVFPFATLSLITPFPGVFVFSIKSTLFSFYCYH